MNAAHNCLELPLLRQQRITARLLGRSTTCPVRVCIVVEIFVRTTFVIQSAAINAVGCNQRRLLHHLTDSIDCLRLPEVHRQHKSSRAHSGNDIFAAVKLLPTTAAVNAAEANANASNATIVSVIIVTADTSANDNSVGPQR
ncbi:unnamed protein product [Ceratitis capitata]|uniref:(Mediterranean fruit fly) hypothetical protein n=1 Tax=Ceratitis capitata TaxID=7213 RepID=A0A811UU91_CERCA|nr:unnamed protein product [Ceratitis capitata]